MKNQSLVKKLYGLRKEAREAKDVFEKKQSAVYLVENEIKEDAIAKVERFGVFTVAHIDYDGFEATGIAKRSPHDVDNFELAVDIAIGRAKRKLLEKITDDKNSVRDPYAG